jgi:hypothetical protein
MQDRPKILTRARYHKLHETLPWPEEEKKRYADTYFNTFRIIGDGSSVTDYLAPAGIAAESEALKKGIEKVLLYANRNLAHRTPEWDPPPIEVPHDTEAALQAVQACFDKFYPILTGKSMPQPTPAIQFDWEESFRHPWMTDEVAAAVRKADEAKRQEQSRAVLERITNRGPGE